MPMVDLMWQPFSGRAVRFGHDDDSTPTAT
jgi:hypothetical protein